MLRSRFSVAIPAAAAVLVGASTVAHAQSLVAYYNFNDSTDGAGTPATTVASAGYDPTTLDLYTVTQTGPVSGKYTATGATSHNDLSTITGITGAADGVLDLTANVQPNANSAYNGGAAAGTANGSYYNGAAYANWNTHTSAFTLAGWFNPAASTTFGSGTRLFDATSNGVNNFLVLATSGGVLELQLGGSSNAADSLTYAPTVGTWNFFAISYDGAGTATFYEGTTALGTSVTKLNSVAITPLSGVGGNTTYLTVGNTTSANRNFNGYMDDLSFWNGGLTQAQVETVRQQNLTGITPGAAPEPASLPLALLGGLGSVATMMRRRIRRAA